MQIFNANWNYPGTVNNNTFGHITFKGWLYFTFTYTDFLGFIWIPLLNASAERRVFA